MQTVSIRVAQIVAAALMLLAGMAVAQPYPSRPVRLIVPFPPGGSIDMLSRVVGERLAERLGQAFVVENKAGASGAVGAEFVARAPPDGYTLLTAPSSVYAVGISLNSRMPFDLQKDLLPISTVAITDQVVNVNPAVPAATLGELIAFTKTRPRQLNLASQGNGTVSHLGCALLANMAGIEWTHVPYKGSAQAITDLISGNVQVMCDASPLRCRTSAPASCERSRWWAASARPCCPTCPRWPRQDCRATRSNRGPG